jgi:hypothetical protein
MCRANVTADRAEFQKAKADCRTLASRLHSLLAAVPLYPLFVDLGAVPERSRVDEAARALIGLSNTGGRHTRSGHSEALRHNLEGFGHSRRLTRFIFHALNSGVVQDEWAR